MAKKRKDGLIEKKIKIGNKRISFYGHTEAEIFRKAATYEEKEKNGPKFETVADEWQEKHFKTLSHNTLKGYSIATTRAITEFGKEYIKDIKPVDVSSYVNYLVSKDFAHKTVSNHLLVLRLIFNYACEIGAISSNPATYIKVPRGLTKNKRRFPTNEEIEIVKSNIDKPMGLFFFFILYTGCRYGEAIALTWNDIDFKNKVIHITKSVYYDPKPKIKSPKSEAGHRDVILLDTLADILLPYKKKKDDLVFSYNGTYYSNRNAWVKMEQYRQETGAKITPHELRHGYATILYESGIDLKTAQYLLGHAQSSTTLDIYVTLRNNMLKDAANKLNELL